MMPQFTDLVTIDEYGCVEDDYTAHLEHSERFWTTHPPTEHPGRARRKRRGEGRVGDAGSCRYLPSRVPWRRSRQSTTG